MRRLDLKDALLSCWWKKCQRFLQTLLGRRTLAVLQPTIWLLLSSMVAAFCEQGLGIIVCLDNMLTMVQNRELLVQVDLVKTILKSYGVAEKLPGIKSGSSPESGIPWNFSLPASEPLQSIQDTSEFLQKTSQL